LELAWQLHKQSVVVAETVALVVAERVALMVQAALESLVKAITAVLAHFRAGQTRKQQAVAVALALLAVLVWYPATNLVLVVLELIPTAVGHPRLQLASVVFMRAAAVAVEAVAL
jgi:hypothetical protein